MSRYFYLFFNRFFMLLKEKNQAHHVLSDQELYKKCQEYGNNARMWMKKFAGLLPEVYRRQLYKRRGFASIHEFAFKIAGMNGSGVDKILNMAERLQDKPILLAQLESGEEGWSKIEKVSFVAKPETDAMWAEKVHTLPQAALSEYVREYRKNNGLETALESDFAGQNWPRLSFPVSPDNMLKLRLLKQQLEKEKKQALSWNEIMAELLIGGIAKMEQGIKKTTVIKICEECVKRKADEQEVTRPSRNIPVAVKRIVDERSKGTCEYPLCLRPASIYHHTRRYALSKNHDPGYIVNLCTVHNHLAHASLIKNEEEGTERWSLKKTPDKNSEKYAIDKLVGEHWLQHPGKLTKPHGISPFIVVPCENFDEGVNS